MLAEKGQYAPTCRAEDSVSLTEILRIAGSLMKKVRICFLLAGESDRKSTI